MKVREFGHFVKCFTISVIIVWVVMSIQFAFLVTEPIPMLLEFAKIMGELELIGILGGLPLLFWGFEEKTAEC
jgi:hypothetical protein